MSLDVSLYKAPEDKACSECGNIRAVREEVFSQNITHNLGKMAGEAGIYKHLWRPEEIGITNAVQLIEPLSAALGEMKADRARFEKLNSPSGWGLYENFVPWIEKYLSACIEYPDAEIHVSR